MSEFDCSGLKAYSGYFNDTEKLLQSSSGGAATAISELILAKGGAVFGSAYSADYRTPEFACIERKEICTGSKVQSMQRQVQVREFFMKGNTKRYGLLRLKS